MNQDIHTLIFPTPSEFSYLEGSFKIPEIIKVHFDDGSYNCLLPIAPLPLQNSEPESANLHFVQEDLRNPEAYKIECSSERITIYSSTQRAGLFALHTLKQILNSSQDELPCFAINDCPTLKRRGFMLDVSRCKVPTMETVFELIDLLSFLRFNELQLYIEHTFAFRDHQTVWNEFSPITGSEIKEIDRYCKDRFIELVPNLNSFGHFERWLRHEPYKKLAECPEGFQRDEPFMVRDHGSVLKPNQDSLKFIDSLYEEYLPHFSSSKFNVGLDEPWELGQGWSRSKVQEMGKHTVYLEHLKGILNLVEKRGKSMEFWADVLLEKPENAKHLPSSASPIIWGYEADHPFDEESRNVASCGLNFSLAPGTANWRSFSGRWKTVTQNLISACENAKKHQAEGILLTTWGDCGNHQPWATLYPPLFLGAQLAWNGNDASEETIGSAIDREVFKDPDCQLGKTFIDLAKLDQIIEFNLPNNSLPWFALFSAQPEKLPQHIAEQTKIEKIEDGLKWLEEIQQKSFSTEAGSPAFLAEQEWKLGIELSTIGIQHAISLLDPSKISSGNFEEPTDLIEKFQEIWLLRARSGGLQEAVILLRQACQKTVQLSGCIS